MKLAVVAGHICLDIIPGLEARHSEALTSAPGTLINVGPAVVSTGGAVSNTGLALHRLGVSARLMGKVGDDLLGRAILDVLRAENAALSQGMIVSQGESSSYTLVISPPHVDRMFLHHPGANDTFGAPDVPDAALQDADVFHFGYPTLMKRMFHNEGAELDTLLRRVKAQGVTTSLDITRPDPHSASGRVDWAALLSRVLPHVDVFLPSLDEIVWMLRPHFLESESTSEAPPDRELLRSLADQILEMGAAVAVLKLGEHGLYARVTPDAARLNRMGRAAPQEMASWQGREVMMPCFEVEVAGTTGAGDCAIAGFLLGLLRGMSLESAICAAAAVGACCCECSDATSGVRPWPEIEARLRAGWPSLRQPCSTEDSPSR